MPCNNNKKDKNEINFGLKTLIRNDNSESVSIIYFESIPWYFRVFISSLIIRKDNIEDENIKPGLIMFFFLPIFCKQSIKVACV